MKQLKFSPNWKNATDYPPLSGTSMDRWAVEFLSRNTKFRKAIEGISGLAGPRNDPYSPFRKRWHEIAEEFDIASPLLSEWGFDSPVSFEIAPYHLQGNVSLKLMSGKWFLGEDHGWGSALVFDLRKPIAPQLRAAERMLKGTKRQGVSAVAGAQRDRAANYPAMLRVLDARAASVPWKTIVQTLFPKKSEESAIYHAKSLHKKAVSLRDDGYRHLPSLAVGRAAKKPAVTSRD